jgi:hypothetical protein
MLKISDVLESVILRDALTVLLASMEASKDSYTDKKLYEDTVRAVAMLKVKYFKIALTAMRKNESGNFEFENAN